VSVLPPNRIAFTEFPAGVCAVCGSEWWQDHPVPTVYSVASIEAELPAEPICDHCVERHDPDLFGALPADRQRFWSS
jgi:hypothetical protein